MRKIVGYMTIKVDRDISEWIADDKAPTNIMLESMFNQAVLDNFNTGNDLDYDYQLVED